MAPVIGNTQNGAMIQKEDHSVFEQPGKDLITYRLRCAQTANGLSHYYMYGDIDPNETLL